MEQPISFPRKFSLEYLVPWLLAASFFILPMSSTGKSVCLSLTVLAILLSPGYRVDLKILLVQPWCKAAIAFFVIALMAFFWSPASYAERFFVLEKYSKLLYLPVLALGFRNAKTRQLALHAFLFAMAFISIVSFLLYYGFLILSLNADNLFRNHIIIGFMVAFASYLSMLLAYRHQGILRIFYITLALLFSYKILFVNAGRMSYILFAMLMLLFVMQTCSWRQAVGGILLICALVILSYFQSPVLKSRVQIGVQEIIKFPQQRDTPIGYRLQFHRYAYQLFRKHILIGNGTGSFTYFFHTEKPVPSWDHRLLEPHSQYWLLAAEFGLLGIGGFLAMLWGMFKTSLRLQTTQPIAMAMLLSFIIGNLTDSLLFYSGPGYFFILMMAVCLGEQIPLLEFKPTDSLSHDFQEA